MKPVLAVLVLVLAASGLLVVSTGSVYGTVKGVPCLRLSPDVCQKPMSNVELRFEAEVGGVTSSTKTGQDGTYKIQLLPGKYRIRVQLIADDHVFAGPSQAIIWPFTSSNADFLIPSGLQ
jgi:hypothetical protein